MAARKRAHPSSKYSSKREMARVERFIRNYVKDAEAKGVVLGISGGIDSAVVAFLAVKSLGAKRVTGLLLFEDEFKNGIDYEDAKEVISKLHIRSVEFRITGIIKAFKTVLRASKFTASKLTLANLKARARMTLLYAVANEMNLLVIGTGDKSEETLGYFTKYGDGGVDFMPIAHLYKTQVKALGRRLGVPARIVEKPSSPNLWKGHKAADELPVDYPVLDRIFEMLFERNKDEANASELVGVSQKIVREIMRRHSSSKHKREYPPMITL